MSSEIAHIFTEPPARSTRIPGPPPVPAAAEVELTIDGRTVSVPAGATILDACRAGSTNIPTLCFLENLTPVNACRLCVVEVAGARTLVPACSRPVEPGMDVQTASSAIESAVRAGLVAFPGQAEARA